MTGKMFEEAGELRDLLFTMMESLPGGLLLADRQGVLLAANRKAGDLLGLAGTSLQGRSCYQLLEQVLGMPADQTGPLRRPGGRLTWAAGPGRKKGAVHLAISRHELQSPFQRLAGFFLVVEDITYLRMMEAGLERQKRYAAMEEMAVHMTQELKNPLGSLELSASILKRELREDPDNERLAGQMLRAIRTMDHLLDNYVTFSSLPAPVPARIDVRAWLERTAARLEEAAREKGISCVRRYGHQRETIVGDPELLHQLSLNLGLNGLESMTAGGELRIETGTAAPAAGRAGFLEVKFIDRGCGIPEELQERIFDPFFTTKDRAGGLGLAIVHHITEAHGGLIQVASRPGHGTTVSVLLPDGGGRVKGEG
ncbi:MAG: ATP-binding protein [Desulfobacteraceae bacterium]|nr:ATP-binding protein [Desulfobacteraceae bacterium]